MTSSEKATRLLKISAVLLFIMLKFVWDFIWTILRLPVRFFYCPIKGHEWLWLGNGFFGFGAPKRNFKCLRCGFKTGHPENHKTVKHQQG